MRRTLMLTFALIVLILLLSAIAWAETTAGKPEVLLASGMELDPSSLDTVWRSDTGKGPPPRLGPNVQVNEPQQPFPDGLLGRNNTSIAVANDKRRMVASWNDADGFCGPPLGANCTAPPVPGLSGYGYSSNGGRSWVDAGAPPVYDDAISRGDPWLDTDGKFFYSANLAADLADGASRGVIVYRGRFVGRRFAWHGASVLDSPANSSSPGADLYDKEALAAAKDGSRAVYLSVTNVQELCGQPRKGLGQIEVWRSLDRGRTWQGPVVAGPEAADSLAACGDEGTLQQSSVPAIGPRGEVYVAWQYGPAVDAAGDLSTEAQIVVARSLDQGATFAEPVTVATINSMRQNPPVAYNRSRMNDHPRLAVATSGPELGRIYVAFASAVEPVAAPATAQSLVSSQVYISSSNDGGETWSEPVAVGPPIPDEGVKRFWPVVTVEPSGKVDVVYLESRETQASEDPNDIECNVSLGGGVFRRGKASSLVDTYWVTSADGGQTFGDPIRVSKETSNWCLVGSNIRPNMGDYIGSASEANRVFPLWADGRNGVPDVFYAKGLSAGRSH